MFDVWDAEGGKETVKLESHVRTPLPSFDVPLIIDAVRIGSLKATSG